MNAVDDDLTKAEVTALCIFFQAEYQRHKKDMQFIVKMMNRLSKRFLFTEEDWKKIKKKSKRYIEFKNE